METESNEIVIDILEIRLPRSKKRTHKYRYFIMDNGVKKEVTEEEFFNDD